MAKRVAYLNTQYPALSHTFIEREVRSLRGLGYEVSTFTVRAADSGHLIDDRNREAFESTVVLLQPGKLLGAELSAMFKSPAKWLASLGAAMRLRPDGVKGFALGLAYHAEAIRLARELKKVGLSHVHVHMANNGTAVAAIACAYDPSLSYSVTVHGPSIFFKPFESKLGDKIAGARFVRVISDFCRSQAMSFCDPEHWSKLEVVHCGMEPAPYVEAGDSVANRDSDSGGGALRLINVARLAPVKGHALLVEAVAMLKARGVAVHVDIVGGGPLTDRLQQEIESRGVADRVTLVGPVGQDKIPARFAAADGFVLPSFAEGVPTVLMEAMAAGRPVVATAIAGTPELVEDGVHGKLVRPGRPRSSPRGSPGWPSGRRSSGGRWAVPGGPRCWPSSTSPAPGPRWRGCLTDMLAAGREARPRHERQHRSTRRQPRLRPQRRGRSPTDPGGLALSGRGRVRPADARRAGGADGPAGLVGHRRRRLDRRHARHPRATGPNSTRITSTSCTRADRGKRKVGPGVIEAFYAGLRHHGRVPEDFDFVCKLDLRSRPARRATSRP